MRFLVDTNIWIFYLKSQFTPVRTKLAATPFKEIAVATIVWGELLHGARKYDDPAGREARVEETLRPFQCLPFDLDAARHYARIRDDLERRGQLIGGNDLMIAAIVLVHGLTLVTNNVGEFSRVPGLKVEDWSV